MKTRIGRLKNVFSILHPFLYGILPFLAILVILLAAEAARAQTEKPNSKEKEPEPVPALFDIFKKALTEQAEKETKLETNTSTEEAEEPAQYFGVLPFLQSDPRKMMVFPPYIEKNQGGTAGKYDKHFDAITSLAVSPDGKYVVSGSMDKTAHVWNLSDKKTVRILQDDARHKQGVTDTFIFPDNKLAMTSSYDSVICLWNIQSGKNTKVYHGAKDRMWSLAVDPTGTYVAGGCNDGKIYFWNLSTVKRLNIFSGHAAPVYDVNFTTDGQYLVSAGGDLVARVWSMITGEEVLACSGHTDRIFSATFDYSGQYILTASRDKTARLWALSGAAANSGRNTGMPSDGMGPEMSSSGMSGMAGMAGMSGMASPAMTAKTPAASPADEAAKKAAETAGFELCRFIGHTGSVRKAIFLGSIVITCADDGTIRFWLPSQDSGTGQMGAGSMAGNKGMGMGADMGMSRSEADYSMGMQEPMMGSPAPGMSDMSGMSGSDGQMGPNAQMDQKKKKSVPLKRPKSKAKGIEIARFEVTNPVVGVNTIALSPDGKTLIAGYADGIVRLWNIPYEKIPALQSMMGGFNQNNNGMGPAGMSPGGNMGPAGMSPRGNMGPAGMSPRGNMGPAGMSPRGNMGPAGMSPGGSVVPRNMFNAPKSVF